MDNDTIIRKFSKSDIDKVMDIWLDTNVKAHDFIQEHYWKSQLDDVKGMIPRSEVYVCEKSEEIIGFVGLSGNYIAGLFISCHSQSKGIGKQLLDYIKSFKSGLYLNVYKKNDRAIKFYQREGFKIQVENIDKNTGEKEMSMVLR